MTVRTLAAWAVLLAACAAPSGPGLVDRPAATAAPQSAAPSPPAALVPAGPVELDGARAKAHSDYFADAARGGRFTGSSGYLDAARYLADQFRAAGLEPYGDAGTYFQTYRQPLVDLSAVPVLELLGDRQRRFRHRTDFTETVGGSIGSGAAEGRVVFIGAGARSSTLDDYAGIDARGAILIVAGARGDPVPEAVRQGAAGLVLVSDRMLKFSYLPRFNPQTLPGLIVSEAAADALIAGSGRRMPDLRRAVDEQGRALSSGGPPGPSLAFDTGNRARLSLELTGVRQVEAVNVVGLLRGSDADEAKRAVLVGGHLDGVGTDPDGTVFPAANDNASGPALTAELARVIASHRSELRRSVVFVAFAGEEQGLHGSEHYASQVSAIPGRPESLLAYLNLDVVGCCGATLGASEDSTQLFARVKRAAEAEGVALEPLRGSSDQASFTRRRVEATQIAWADIGPIHTTRDVPALVTAGHLATAGRVAARVILELAAGD